jgi:hypothetical protein
MVRMGNFMKFSLLSAGLCLLPLHIHVKAQTVPSAQPVPAPNPVCTTQGPIDNWNAAAQLIAGVNNAAYAGSMTADQKAAWTDYSKTAAADWNRLKRRYVDRISAWRGKYLQKSAAVNSVFYPFSGPDATNPLAFFPDAGEYVLVGLEPAGCIPSKAEDFTPEYWPALRQGWQTAASMGFFKTENMERDLAEGPASGVLPVLLFLIARAGNSVVDVTPLGITPTGALIASNDKAATETRGLTIHYKDSSQRLRTLRYLALNLQNRRLARKPGTTKYLQTLPRGGTLVKSASYLMHKKYFSTIRSVILDRSTVVIEDDSGIPYHYFFEPPVWDVHLFGAYDQPIGLFKSGLQDDLKAAYDARTGVDSLDFGIGYKWQQNQSNLLLAVRKK